MNKTKRKRTKRKIATTSGNWSDLHEDLVSIIAKKLHVFDDILSFRSVCTTWRSASTTDSINVANQLPWMLQAKKEAEGVNKKYMFDLAHDKYYESFKFSEFKTLCLGWKGWVLAVKKKGTMRLLHAFKSLRSPCLPGEKSLQEGRYDRITVCKAVLSADPLTNPSDYILVIIYDGARIPRKLAFWRPGDKVYTNLQVDGVCDAAFHGGQLYAVYWKSVMVFDVAGLELTYRFEINIPYFSINTNSMGWSFMDYYLVELGGELVLLTGIRGLYCVKFNMFSVLDGWKEVKDLGNKAIFIGGTTQSFALDDASEIPGCKPNHIYFITVLQGRLRPLCGIYNCTDATVEFLECNSCKHWCDCPHPSLWVQPTFD